MRRMICVWLVAVVLGGCVFAGQGAGGSGRLPRVFCLKGAWLAEAKGRIAAGDKSLRPALDKLVGEADEALGAGPFSVMDKTRIPPSGDKHDYMSFGPYWWPDPDKADGLPYIRRDGQVNPDSRGAVSDRVALGRMVDAVETLALAYYFTEKAEYARHAARLVRVWFLDEATKMNPNLQFGQAIPGRVEGRGIGLIDTARLPRVVDAAGLIGSSGAWTADDQAGLIQWFGAFLDWMLSSKYGKDEQRTRNNHATWYDVQVASFALFAGRADLAKQTVEAAKGRRIDSQIRPAGSQPHELARTKSLGYSTMNLRGFFTLARLGDCVGVDLWRYRGSEGQSLKKALDFIAPYADADRRWPHKQIKRFDRTGLLELLVYGRRVFADETYGKLIGKLPADKVAAHRIQLKTSAVSLGLSKKTEKY